jgi:auxin responsive GH3 family protein
MFIEKDTKALQFINNMTTNVDPVPMSVLKEILTSNAEIEYLKKIPTQRRY